MPVDRTCQNPVCNKSFRTSHHRTIFCSPPCKFWHKIRLCPHGQWCPFCCWEWTAATNPAGYGMFGIKKREKWVNRAAPAVAWELVNARSIPQGLQINHHCDNPLCCSIWHIYAGTKSQNSLDAYQRQRMPIGEARSHLKTHEVLSVASLYRQGHTLLAIAEAFHTSQSVIYNILSGKTWKHLSVALSQDERRALALAHYRATSLTRKSTFLTEEQVRAIRALRQQGVKQRVLAQQFGVNVSVIKSVEHRRSWKWVS